MTESTVTLEVEKCEDDDEHSDASPLHALIFNHEPIDADPFPPMPHISLRDSPLPVIHKPKSFHLIPVSG